MVSDTLSMPTGKGGFTKLGLSMDVYSQWIWATKLKKENAATSALSFKNICQSFTKPETLMTDGGPKFDNKELREACQSLGMKLHIIPVYSLWINRLLEGTNTKLLGRLKCMCAPNLEEDDYTKMEWKDLLLNWPDHLETALLSLNNRILPNLKYSPNELLLGLVINTKQTPLEMATVKTTEADAILKMAYTDQHHLDGYLAIINHAHHQKMVFTKKVLAQAPKELIFKAGQLVQVYQSDLNFTFKTEHKMEPKWSAPRRVVERNQNSYKIETLESFPINGWFSSQRLQRFILRMGTALAEAQEAMEEQLGVAEQRKDRVKGEEEMEGMEESLEDNEVDELKDDMEEEDADEETTKDNVGEV